MVALNPLHRDQVLAFKSAQKTRWFTCFADCSENVSLVSVSAIKQLHVLLLHVAI